jgi:lipoyl(octanoyl) transferase
MAWRFIDFQRFSAFENMAVDEAIFKETVKNKRLPTIRFYGWRPAAVSIGYFQDLEKEVNIDQCRTAGVDIVRRLSGGKAVFHCHEVTYSVIACSEEKSFPSDILGTYKIISNCIARGLAHLGIKAVLAETGRNWHNTDFKSCCFSLPSKNELLVAGRKICGSAQMRASGGFLQHGSILMDFDPVKTAAFLLPMRTPAQLQKLKKSVAAINEEIAAPIDENEVCSSLKKGFIAALGINILEGTLTPDEEELASNLIQKYANLSWNREGKKEHFTSGD